MCNDKRQLCKFNFYVTGISRNKRFLLVSQTFKKIWKTLLRISTVVWLTLYLHSSVSSVFVERPIKNWLCYLVKNWVTFTLSQRQFKAVLLAPSWLRTQFLNNRVCTRVSESPLQEDDLRSKTQRVNWQWPAGIEKRTRQAWRTPREHTQRRCTYAITHNVNSLHAFPVSEATRPSLRPVACRWKHQTWPTIQLSFNDSTPAFREINLRCLLPLA